MKSRWPSPTERQGLSTVALDQLGSPDQVRKPIAELVVAFPRCRLRAEDAHPDWAFMIRAICAAVCSRFSRLRAAATSNNAVGCGAAPGRSGTRRGVDAF